MVVTNLSPLKAGNGAGASGDYNLSHKPFTDWFALFRGITSGLPVIRPESTTLKWAEGPCVAAANEFSVTVLAPARKIPPQ